MKTRLVLILCLCAQIVLAQAPVQLSGTVYDKDNKPLPGMVVSLIQAGLSDTTGADGTWKLQSSSTRTNAGIASPQSRWDGRFLQLRLPSPALVQVEAFDARGQRLDMLSQVQLGAGSHEIPLSLSGQAQRTRWLLLHINGKAQVLANGSGTRVTNAALPAPLAKEATTEVEQLVFTLQGQLVTADTIVNLIQSGLDKWIQEYLVSGKVSPNARVAVDSVFAWFDGGKMTGMRRARLGFNTANSAYSGRIFSVKSLMGDVYNYRLWLNVMGNGNRRVGISDTVDFSSDFGSIDFIPTFSVANAIPAGSIEGPVSGLVNTDFTYSYLLTRPDESIAHQEWDAGEGLGFLSGLPTHTLRWLQPGSYTLRLRLTDSDSNSTEFTKTVNITNQAATVSGIRDTTITPDDVLVFALTAQDVDGVAKVLWDFGDGSTDSSFGGPLHQVSHKYPGTSAVAVGQSKVYPLKARIVDLLGNETPQSANITVDNDMPLVDIHDTTGELGTQMTLHATATDRGTIARIEWSLDGKKFQDGRADTTIQLPAIATMNYPVYVRATDEDGSISKVDTVRIIVAEMITDVRDGQKYRVVTIGTQTWMAENLNYSGDDGAGHRTYTKGWCYGVGGDSDTTKHYDSTSCDNGYGRLYRWTDAMNIAYSYLTVTATGVAADLNTGAVLSATGNNRGICPAGWHVPSDAEWTALTDFVEAKDAVSSNAGAWLKAVVPGNTGWNNSSKNQQDSLGFSALPAGGRGLVHWSNRTSAAYFWSASEDGGSDAWRRFLVNYNATVDRYGSNKGSLGYGESLRCLQD